MLQTNLRRPGGGGFRGPAGRGDSPLGRFHENRRRRFGMGVGARVR